MSDAAGSFDREIKAYIFFAQTYKTYRLIAARAAGLQANTSAINNIRIRMSALIHLCAP